MKDDNLLERIGPFLTGMTVLGLIVALFDRFVIGLTTVPIGASALWVVYLCGGLPAAVSALRELFAKRILDIDLLMVIAALAAASVDAALEGAVLLALFSLSSTLEHRAMGKARRAVEALMALRPERAQLRHSDGTVEEVAVADLNPGDVVVLRPGARVPVDGSLMEGEGNLDESSITGESLPVHKAPGARLSEATVNLNAVLVLRVERSLAESTVARMIALVTEAQAMKAPSERFSEWFGQRYTVAVLIGSSLLFLLFIRLGWPIDEALYRAATVLVAASPCAVVISVPAAILSALSAAARGGVLFKGGAALETLAEVRAFAFDKTGTLTTGKAELSRVIHLDGDGAALLSLAAGIEENSEHHIADAIRRAAAAAGVKAVDVVDVVTRPSEGITGKAAGETVWAGNLRMVAHMGASAVDDRLVDVQDGSETVIYIGRAARLLGVVTVADTPRDTSRIGLQALRDAGIGRLVMMTGDRRSVALSVGKKLGFSPEDIHADLLPDQKVALVDALAKDGRVAFVGDGVNDAAALARADVGIAMGVAGSEVALQAAEVALLSDNMERLAAAQRLARRTARIIRQNLIFALGAMILLVIGGAFFQLPLPLAVLGHEGGTLLVVLNGLRLLFDPIRVDRPRSAKVTNT
jgi:heavy metal translocating P-type ATPase